MMKNKPWTKHQKSGAYQTQSLIFQFLASCKEIMEELGMTQKALADKLGCSRAQITQWLNEDANLTLVTVGKVMAGLGIRKVRLVMESDDCPNLVVNSNKFSTGGVFAVPVSPGTFAYDRTPAGFMLGVALNRSHGRTISPSELLCGVQDDSPLNGYNEQIVWHRRSTAPSEPMIPLPHVIDKRTVAL